MTSFSFPLDNPFYKNDKAQSFQKIIINTVKIFAWMGALERERQTFHIQMLKVCNKNLTRDGFDQILTSWGLSKNQTLAFILFS